MSDWGGAEGGFRLSFVEWRVVNGRGDGKGWEWEGELLLADDPWRSQGTQLVHRVALSTAGSLGASVDWVFTMS